MNRQFFRPGLHRLLSVAAVLGGLVGLSGLAQAASAPTASYCTATYTISSVAANGIGYFNTTTNGVTGIFNSASNNGNALAQSPINGNLYYIDRVNSQVHSVDVNSGTDSTLTTINTGATVVGGTTDSAGNYYVSLGNASFAKVATTGTGAQNVTYTNYSAPAGYTLNTVSNGDFAIDSSGQAYTLAEATATPTGVNPGYFLWQLNLTSGALSAPVPLRTTAAAQWPYNGTAGNLSTIGTVNGLMIDPVSGTFYVSTSTGPNTTANNTTPGLYTLDKSSGITAQKSSATGLTDLGGCPVLPNPPTVSKSFSPTSAVGTSGTTTLTLTLSNSDLAPVYIQSVFTDTLPTNMVVATTPALSTTCSATPTAAAGSSTVTLPAGTKLAANTNCTITVNVTATGAGTYTNTIPAGALDTTAGKNTAASATYTLQAQPTLTLNKTIANPGRVNAADQFTVQILNGTTLTASGSTANTGTTATTGSTALTAGTAYTLNEVMAAGSSSALGSYNTAISCSNTNTGSSTALPSGSGQSFTLTPAGNDVISCTLTNTPKQNDLAINKTGPSVVTQGSAATYTLKVWNIGPDSVTGATIADTVPSNLTGVTWSCAASGSAVCGTASGNGNAISFASGLLPVNNTSAAPTSGSYLTITVTGTASTAGNLTNTATVSTPGGSLDPASGNNSSSQATTVNAPPTTANVTNAVLVNTAGATALSPNLSATDSDGTIASYTIATLPAAASGVLALNGTAVTAGQTFPASQLSQLTFAPAAGYSGTASFTYKATDNQGAVSNTSTYSIPVNAPPTTANVTNAVLLDTAPATVLSPNLSATDSDGTIASYTIATLPAAASGVLALNGTAVTAGQTFAANQLGTLTFKPVAGFNGTASFTYSATDNQGATSNTSTYTVPVNVAPVANNDTSSTPANTAKTFSITGNDTDTSPGTVNATTTLFSTSGQPNGSTLSNGNRTIAVPNEGSYTLDNSGNVTFTPVNGYSGTTTPVKYTVQDNQGATSNVASVTVTVTPVATNDTASTTPSTLVNIPVLSNDIGSGKAASSVVFPGSGQPTGSTVSNGGKTLTDADGTYTVRNDGTVDFTPALGKTGTLSPVAYTFQDGAGQTSNAATITVTVGAITPPTATNDSASTPKNTAVTLSGSTNDTAGSLAIDNSSVTFPTSGQPGTATVSNGGKTLTVSGQGTYQVQTNGTVVFTPVSTFAGTATPVYYTVKDTAGTSSNAATLNVTVTNQPPVANNVTNALLTSTAPATALSPGVSGSDPDGNVVTYTVTTLPTPAMGTLYCNGTAIANTPSNCAPNQLSFKPNATFNGNATFQYTVTDDNGATSNVATYTIPVNVPPVANNDSGATNPGVNVTFSVTGNDTDTSPGTVDVTTTAFDASSTGTISNGGKTLTVSGQGVFTLDNNGNVTFAPAAGFTNGTSTARYTVKDNQGAVSNVATITVSVPASVDLAITKSGPSYFKPGDTLNYTLTVTDSGSAATGVKVTDTLPSGLTFASAGSGGTYDAGTGKVTWTLGNVANGSTTTLTLSGTAPGSAGVEANNGPTSLNNTASVAGNETETVTSNNSASSTAQLVYPKLSKRVRNLTQNGTFGTVGSGKPGEVLEYCIDFKNYGVAVAGFVISDSVPGNTTANPSAYGAGLGLQVVRGNATSTRTSTGSDADGGSLSASALSLDLGTLAAGESGSVCFQASIK